MDAVRAQENLKAGMKMVKKGFGVLEYRLKVPPLPPGIHPSVLPSVRPFIHPSIRPSVDPIIPPSIHPPTCITSIQFKTSVAYAPYEPRRV
jgi:hypothetical protein